MGPFESESGSMSNMSLLIASSLKSCKIHHDRRREGGGGGETSERAERDNTAKREKTRERQTQKKTKRLADNSK